MDMKHASRAILMVKAYVNAKLLENRYFVKIIRVITVLYFYSSVKIHTNTNTPFTLWLCSTLSNPVKIAMKVSGLIISPKKSFRKTKNIYRIVCYMFIDLMDFTFYASNVQQIYIKMRCRFSFSYLYLSYGGGGNLSYDLYLYLV
jgi:hypothetical protein